MGVQEYSREIPAYHLNKNFNNICIKKDKNSITLSVSLSPKATQLIVKMETSQPTDFSLWVKNVESGAQSSQLSGTQPSQLTFILSPHPEYPGG